MKHRDSGTMITIPTDTIAALGSGFIRFVAETGNLLRFVGRALFWLVRPPFRAGHFLAQFFFIANRSIFIVTVTSLFTGMVFALQFYFGFSLVQADTLVGPASALSLARELAPVFTAVVVTGRAGAAMAAELGTMRVTEQIDAMDAMAVSSVQYLVTPRILMGTIALPVLSILFLLIGNFGSYLVGVYFLGIDPALFYSHLESFIVAEDIYQGLIKAAIFGFMFSSIATYFGYNATGGAEAVGRATNRAVVTTLVLVLISDYFLTLLIRHAIYPDI